MVIVAVTGSGSSIVRFVIVSCGSGVNGRLTILGGCGSAKRNGAGPTDGKYGWTVATPRKTQWTQFISIHIGRNNADLSGQEYDCQPSSELGA